MQIQDIPKWAKNERKKCHKTIVEFSEYTGIAQRTINSIELGQRTPRLDTFCTLLDSLGYELDIRKKGT